MYSTKEKLRILREINNPEAVGADIALFRQAMPADPRLVKFDLSPQRHHEEITLSLLERFTREEIVANRREYYKAASSNKSGEDNSDLDSMTDEEREVLKGYNRAQRDRIKAICADSNGQDVADALRAEGFDDIAAKVEANNQNQVVDEGNNNTSGNGSGEGSGDANGDGTGEKTGEGSDRTGGESGDGSGDGSGDATGDGTGEKTEKGTGEGSGEGSGKGTGDDNQEDNGNGDKTDEPEKEKPADEPEKEKPADESEKEKPADEAAAGEETKKKSGKTRNTPK